MSRRSIKIQSFIIFASILITALEYGCYYFFDTLLGAAGIAVLLSLIFAHIFLESSLTYSSCFLQSAVTVVLSTAATAFIYVYQTGNLLIYSKNLIFLIFLNWLVPLVYSIFRNFMDHGPRFVAFRSYFRNTSILFFVYYLVFFVVHYFILGAHFPAGISAAGNPWVPFLATAAYIEDSIYLGQPLSTLLVYAGKTILIFAPVGFYATLLLKEVSRKLILLLTLLLPMVTELMPLLQTGTCSVDAYLYNLIGIVCGILLYQLLNSISHHCLSTDFLAERNKYSFFNFYF